MRKELTIMSKIKSLKYFECGYCVNQESMIFKGVPKKEVLFPAGVFLINHEDLGYILYDTGYAVDVASSKKLKYLLYRLPNPIHLKREDCIDRQLEKLDIKVSHINHIIISHLHPDHIGCLKLFPNADFYLSRKAYQCYLKPKFRELIFQEYFPEDFDKRLQVLDFPTDSSLLPGQKCLDFLMDASIMAYSLDGHAKGQLCLHLPEKKLFLAADTVWRTDMLDKIDRMRTIPRLIQSDFKAYQNSIELLKDIQKQGIEVLVSHEDPQNIRRILHE
ncbi:metallo-beta-lactamase domain protein [Streptococcus porcinus str. Jelinkova 176]|uniref:Metallo-beta-lactamase domain protein n=2 Tax=Streptococcus porcinus TaxID=1340 RepID=A0ABN0CVR7_STRPO|nr:metallo-beta-lactamase domain protein [Streptococcus porcinus str. Jelinkova 176]